jgi:hypothetical protein
MLGNTRFDPLRYPYRCRESIHLAAGLPPSTHPSSLPPRARARARPGVLRTPGLEGRAQLDPYIAKSRARFVRRQYAPPFSHSAAAAAKAAAAEAAAAAAARPPPPAGVRRSRRGAAAEAEAEGVGTGAGSGGRLAQVAEDGEEVRAARPLTEHPSVCQLEFGSCRDVSQSRPTGIASWCC